MGAPPPFSLQLGLGRPKSRPLPQSQHLHEAPLNRLLSEYIRLIKTDVGCRLNANTSRHVIPFPTRPGNPGLRDAASFGAVGGGRGQKEVRTPPSRSADPSSAAAGEREQEVFQPVPPNPIDPTPTERRVAPPPPGFPTPGAPARSPREGNAPSHTLVQFTRPRAPLDVFPRSPPPGLGCSVSGHTTPHPGGASRRQGDPGRRRSPTSPAQLPPSRR